MPCGNGVEELGEEDGDWEAARLAARCEEGCCVWPWDWVERWVVVMVVSGPGVGVLGPKGVLHGAAAWELCSIGPGTTVVIVVIGNPAESNMTMIFSSMICVTTAGASLRLTATSLCSVWGIGARSVCTTVVVARW